MPTDALTPVYVTDRQTLRLVTRTLYDRQHERIMIGNRLAAHFRVQLGQAPGQPSSDLAPEAIKLLVQLKEEYGRLADGLAHGNRRRWQKLLDEHTGIIHSPEELVLVSDYVLMEQHEVRLGRDVAALVKEFPIWLKFLEGVRGCGPLMSAVIISEFDPYKARHASSFFKYAGIDVAEDGRGRSRREEHLVQREYTAKDGTQKMRNSVTFNPFLKTKLMGVLAGSFLRSGSQYRSFYDTYKHRMENHRLYGLAAQEAKAEGATPLHRHNMALRYMVKMFLVDLWKEWRALEGLEVGLSYAEQYLGHTHGADPGNPLHQMAV